MRYLLFLFTTSCASTVYMREIQIEECATTHLKVLSKKQTVTEDYYEKVVDSCRNTYTGRR